jgi:hypothetical protein
MAAPNRHEIIAALAAIERALDDRLVLVRTIINPDGTVVSTYRQTVIQKEKPHDRDDAEDDAFGHPA